MIKLNMNGFKIIVAQLFTQIMDRALLVSVIWYLTQYHDKSNVAIFLAVVTIPYIFSLTYSSVVINALSIIKVIYLTDFLKSLLFLCAFIFLPISPPMADFCILFFMISFLESLFNPAILSIPQLIVDESNVHKMTAWLNTCISVGGILGPIFSVVIFRIFHMKGLLLFAALVYFISAMIELTIKTNQPVKKVEKIEKVVPILKNPWFLFNALDKKILFFLAISFFMNLFFTPLQIFIPIYIHKTLKLGMTAYMHLQVVMGLGSIVGCLFISLFTKLSNRLGFIIISTFYLVTTVFYVLFSLGYSFYSVLTAIFCIEFFMNAGNVVVLSMYQKLAKEYEVPFVMSCVMFMSVATAPLAMLISSFAIHFYAVKKVVETYAHLSLLFMFLAFIASIIMINSKLFLNKGCRNAN